MVLIMVLMMITTIMMGMMTIDVGDENEGEYIGEDATTSQCKH